MKTIFVLFIVLVRSVLSSDLYTSSGDVVILTDSNFDELVLQSDSLWMVEFFANWCGHCKSFAPQYLKAASALKGMVRIGAVESAESKLMQKFGVKGFPTIKIFGADKSKPTEYEGGRTAESVVKTLVKYIEKSANDKLGVKASSGSGSSGSKSEPGKDGDVVILSDDNFEDIVLKSEIPVFVKFFSPNCGHCRNMADDWRDAATQLKGAAIVAELDATRNPEKSHEYKVRGYPTIKLFHKDTTKKQITTDYEGGRSASEFVNFVFETTGIVKPGANDDLKLTHLNSHEEFENECMSKKLCVIAFLPPLEDSSDEERKKIVKSLESVMKSTSSPHWGWFYTDGLVNEDFERSLGFIDVSYPVVTSIHPSKSLTLPMLKYPTEANLKAYIGDLFSSKIRGQPLPKTLPKFKSIPEKDEL